MSDEQKLQPWLQQEGEPALWFRRFDRYRLMWPVRKIASVFQAEQTEKNREKPRTIPTGDWYEMANEWRWEERAAAWDAYMDAELEKTIAAERKKILRSELALQHKRVELLNSKAKQLAAITDNPEQVWLLDVKSIGTGPDAERVDLVQFNDAAFKELREYLSDIADEMGERVKKKEVAYKELPPDAYEGITEKDEGSVE